MAAYYGSILEVGNNLRLRTELRAAPMSAPHFQLSYLTRNKRTSRHETCPRAESFPVVHYRYSYRR